MINIVHAFFPRGRHPGNRLGPLGTCVRTAAAGLVLASASLFLTPAPVHARPGFDPVPSGPLFEPFTFPCGLLFACDDRRPPGPPDRDVHPFDRRLGRPCAWRERDTPEGLRRVRVCF